MNRLIKEQSQRLFQQLHQDDNPDWHRASGKMTCYLCGYTYSDHPKFDEQTFYGEPIDHRLCSGEVVHL